MDTWVFLVIATLAVIAIAAAIAAAAANSRRNTLQERFGPEYDRTLGEFEKRRQAERELADRASERDQLELRPLTAAARARYADEWHDVQARFVDAPSASLSDADELVTRVMRDRGYPADEFDKQARLVSVDHPAIVENYRAAHAVFLRDQQGNAETEELRGAVVYYRSLFEELLRPEKATSTT
jgi:hypothetical protein